MDGTPKIVSFQRTAMETCLVEELFCILSIVIAYNQKQLRDLTFSSSKEWLLTDGEGGYSSSTVSFMNTRRQHSLLMVSLAVPLKRFALLNKVDEEVIIEGKPYFLGANRYSDTVFPEGYRLLGKFTFDYFPQVTYDISGCLISKSVLMPKKSSSVFIHYENHSKKAITLRLLPLVSFRFKDSVRKSDESFLIDELPDGIRIIADVNLPRLYLKLSQMYNTSPESHWYYGFVYPHDSDKYKDDREDLFNMGFWETELEPEKELTFAASTRDLGEFNYSEIVARFIEDADRVRESCGLPKRYSLLANSAANHFVHTNALRSSAVIDGYPYGGINIPETLTALQGISFAAASQNFGHEFLHELASNDMNGSLPSSVDEDTLQINYENPQIPLYFAYALARRATEDGNMESVRRYLPLLETGIDIIMKTRSDAITPSGGIHFEKDSHLLRSTNDNPDNPLRIVENAFLNALWYNILKLVDDTKLSAGSPEAYSEITSEIGSAYYESFFETDGSYKTSGKGEGIDFRMAMPLIMPYSPLSEEQKTKICQKLVSRFSESYESNDAHNSPQHSCNLVAIYLLEASRQLKDCEKESGDMKWYTEKMLTLQGFTNCVNGLPKCGSSAFRYDQDISSAVVAGEAVRLIKKLKLR
jgi:predicted glycogen debranching enzyme